MRKRSGSLTRGRTDPRTEDLHPVQNLKLIARLGLQWRLTTEDAVYVIPNRPVPGTAGQPGHWTGVYEQLRAEWQINRNWTAAVEGVQYQVAM